MFIKLTFLFARICPVRGYGSFLSYDGFPPPLRILNISFMYTSLSLYLHLVVSVVSSNKHLY